MRGMRWLYISLGFLLVVSGCGTTPTPAASGGDDAPVWTESDAAEGVSNVVEGGDETVIIPVTSSTGVVATVNEPLRFVVLDYALATLPQIDQVLFLYRRGQKVAQVKVTGPARGQTIAADIVEGSAEAGDEVRSD